MSDVSSLGALQPRDLPVPREAAIRLINACTRSDVTSGELASLIAADPVLTAELLRLVNSAFFGLAHEVRSAARAVTILGQHALRNVVLCIAVRDALLPDALPGLDPAQHWQDALRRAVSARLLARQLALDPEECFTIGLLQDFGLLVLFMRWPEHAAQWPRFLACDPDCRYAMEQQLFSMTHDEVAAYLAQAWGLPDDMRDLLGRHHDWTPPERALPSDPRIAVLYCADWLAAVYTVEDKNAAIAACRERLEQCFELSAEQTDSLLAAIPEQVELAAAALDLTIEPQSDFQEVLRAANLRLSQENLSYQELTWRLENTLRERDALAAELNREIELAREIQRSLLPAPMGPDGPVIGINVPARQLSGDFYDFFTLKDGSILFNVGDVSGKGMNAALLMAKATSLFRCMGKRIPDPGPLLAHVNEELCETTIRGMFVTMIAGLYWPEAGTVRLVNAGHPPALLFRDGQLVQSFGAQAPPVGVLRDTLFPAVDLRLDGGSLYIVSDGITEARVDGEHALGVNGLVEMIQRFADLAPGQRLQDMVERLRDSSPVLRDDMTILLIGNHGPSSEQRHVLRFAAEASQLARIRAELQRILRSRIVSRQLVDQLVLAVNEACMNVVQHGYGATQSGDMVLEITLRHEHVEFHLSDFAPPVDPERLRPRDLAEVRPGGLGLCLMHQIMDEVRYLAPPPGISNHLRMSKRLTPE